MGIQEFHEGEKEIPNTMVPTVKYFHIQSTRSERVHIRDSIDLWIFSHYNLTPVSHTVDSSLPWYGLSLSS